MKVSVKILLTAMQHLPLFDKWDKNRFVFCHAKKEERITLVFTKNKEMHMWELDTTETNIDYSMMDDLTDKTPPTVEEIKNIKFWYDEILHKRQYKNKK